MVQEILEQAMEGAGKEIVMGSNFLYTGLGNVDKISGICGNLYRRATKFQARGIPMSLHNQKLSLG